MAVEDIITMRLGLLRIIREARNRACEQRCCPALAAGLLFSRHGAAEVDGAIIDVMCRPSISRRVKKCPMFDSACCLRFCQSSGYGIVRKRQF